MSESTVAAIKGLAKDLPGPTIYAPGPSPHVPPQRESIALLASNLDVKKLHEELLAAPELWNEHKQRTELYAHDEISDIWLRYNDADKHNGDLAKLSEEHDPIWYPAFDKLPAAAPIIFNVMRFAFGERLGGVLITKVPAGAKVKRHVDLGWHATYYQKFAVQIAADENQVFCFDDTSLVTATGDLFTFDNQKPHWVENHGETDRITMIVCVRSSLDWLEHEGG